MSLVAQIAILPPGTHEIVIQDIELPAPAPFQVLVEQIAFGLCHSNLDRVFDTTRTEPMLLGHESIARVLAVGSSVDYVAPGDEVFTTWIPRTPQAGRQPVPSALLLPDGSVARTHNTYTWGTHALIDEQWVVKVPSGGVDSDLGSILGCALMTGAGAVMNSVQMRPGETVAVWGAGGVGLCSISAASFLGAGAVIAVDVNDDKLALAKTFGATHTINARTSDPVETIRTLTPRPDGTSGVDYGIDCTGIGANIPVSLAAVRPGISGSGLRGGTDVLVGIPRAPFELSSFDLLRGEKSLVGSVGGSAMPERDFARLVDWCAQGGFHPDLLITDRFALQNINDAVEALHSGAVMGRAIIEISPRHTLD